MLAYNIIPVLMGSDRTLGGDTHYFEIVARAIQGQIGKYSRIPDGGTQEGGLDKKSCREEQELHVCRSDSVQRSHKALDGI